MVYQSTRELWALERKGSPSTALGKAYKVLYPQYRDVIPLSSCVPDLEVRDNLFLMRRKLQQAKGDASSLCGEAELGPIKHWYRILLFGNLETTREGPATNRPYFSNMDLLAESGYVLWDDVDFGWEPLPSIEELNERAIREYRHRLNGLSNSAVQRYMDLRFGTAGSPEIRGRWGVR